VVNVASALALILDIFEAHIGDLAAGWRADEKRRRWVPLASIFGTNEVPPAVGRVVLQALEKTEAGDVGAQTPWLALEYWAADYLAGSMPE
jgi:hypothetical protein